MIATTSLHQRSSRSTPGRFRRAAVLTAGLLFGVLMLLGNGGTAQGQDSVTPVARDVNRKMVKLFGAGGFKGLPSYGTGIVVSPKGYILTVNNHILNTVDLRVHLADGRFYHAKVVAKEPELDVALVKIDDKVDGLPAFDFATEASTPLAGPGTWVLAFSNQFQIATREEPMSVMHGVISAYAELRGRKGIFEAPFQGKVYFIDVVACNPGAAGGIITNQKGHLLALIGRELKNKLSDAWINYSVPIQAQAEFVRDGKTVTVTMADFVKEGMAGTYKQGKRKEVTKKQGGYSGIILVPNVVAVTPPYVDGVIAGSPAAKAGIRQDDLIVYIDGELVPSIKEFRRIMETYNPGEELRIDVQRGNRLESVTLKLEPNKQAGQ
jgi:serine protease Do